MRDSFGSLKPERVLDYMAKCFARDDRQVDAKDGGAGLGLYYVFNSTHHFVVNIAPGKNTEAIGLLEVTGRYRDHVTRAKSFNVFVADNN